MKTRIEEKKLLDFPIKWDKNTTLYEVMRVYQRDRTQQGTLVFGFVYYDCEYQLYVKIIDLEKSDSKFTVYGDSELFNSFENKMEDEFWDKIKATAKAFLEYEND